MIPSSVETNGNHAFADCPKLKNFYYCGISDLQTINNCFTNTDLVTYIFVSFKYPYSTFASKTITQTSDCPSYCPQFPTLTPFYIQLSCFLYYRHHLTEISIPLFTLFQISFL